MVTRKKVYLTSQDIYDVHEYGVNLQDREIFLHGYLDNDLSGGEPGVEYRMATTFIKNLRTLDKNGDALILVHMHSVGGHWNDGIAIYDAICQTKSPVYIVAYAHARSMSSIIFQAADKRWLMPNTDFMIHFGTMSVDSNAISVQSEVAWNQYLNTIMLNIYLEGCKKGRRFSGWSDTRIKKFLKKQMEQKQEWYMTPDEAVAYGFADGIVGKDYCLP